MSKVQELIDAVNRPIKKSFGDKVRESLDFSNPGLEHKQTLMHGVSAGCNRLKLAFGEDLSEIINQDGDDKTDGQVLDEIVEYLKELKIYKERK